MKLEKKLILGSNSPRRKEILEMAGIEFEVVVKPVDESFEVDMDLEKVPEYLAQKKALAFGNEYDNHLILTSDTVVIINNTILNKPENQDEAREMLQLLSGNSHEVVTSVCIKNGNEMHLASDKTWVTFKPLSEREIDFYIKNYRPFDKAGAYGVQDFIGMIGVTHLSGSFYTVMGLPIHVVYQLLLPYIRL